MKNSETTIILFLNHRNADYEKNRERKIRYELGCDFFRFNPDEQNFNIHSIIYIYR